MRRLLWSIPVVFAAAAPCAAQECVLSLIDQPAKDRVVTDFANTLYDKRAAMGNNLLQALASFETTMKFDAKSEAEPKILEALLDTAISESASYLIGAVDKKVPGTSQIAAAIKAVYAEEQRAAAAKASHDVGAWIRAERALVANTMTDAGEATQDGDSPVRRFQTSVEIKDAILEDLCHRDDLETAIEEIAAAQSELGAVPSEQTYRRTLFEDWINANYRAIGSERKTPGTVHIAWEVDVEGDPGDHSPGSYPLEWDSDWTAIVVLPSPYGERVAGGLDELGVKPLEARVTKKVCFETDGAGGGTATYCGAIGPDGRDRSTPETPWATQAFESSKWREDTTSFRD